MITRPELIQEICAIANIQRDQQSKTDGFFTRTELEKLYTYISILKNEIKKLTGGTDEQPKT